MLVTLGNGWRCYIPTVRWQPHTYWRIAPFARSFFGERWFHVWLGHLYIFWPWPFTGDRPGTTYDEDDADE